MTTALALAAGFLLAAAPVERVAVLPFEPLGLSAERALGVERAVRKHLASMPRVVVLDAVSVRSLLDSDASLRGCVETRCLASIAEKLDAHSVVSGVVAGLGSFCSLVVKRTDREGRMVTSVSEAIPDNDGKVPDVVCAVMGRKAGCYKEEPLQPTLIVPPPPSLSAGPTESAGLRATRKAALGVGAGAVAAFAVAAGFGLSANALSGEVERKELTCAGATAADCLAGKLATGRTHATVSNAFWGVGGALAAAAVVLFVLPESKQAVALGPGPAPIGLNVHARF